MMNKNKKRALALMLASVTAAGTVMGCGGTEKEKTDEGSKDATQTESTTGETAAADDSVPAFDDIEFPETMPANPTLAEEDYYSYDDMSVHYEINMETYNYGYPLPEEVAGRKV